MTTAKPLMFSSVVSVNAPSKLSDDPSSIVKNEFTTLPPTELNGGVEVFVIPELKQETPCTWILPASVVLLGAELPVLGSITVPPCLRVT